MASDAQGNAESTEEISFLSNQAEKAPAPPGRWRWIAALVVLCVLILLFRTALVGSSGPDRAYRVGASLTQALIVWALFRWGFLRRRTKVESAVAYGVIYACVFVAGEGAHARELQELARAAASIQNVARTLNSSMLDSSGAPQSTHAIISKTPTATGDAGAFEQFGKQVFGKVQAMRNAYLRDIERAGWPSILDPQRLRHDRGLVESLAMIEAVHALIDKHEKIHAGVMAAMRADAEAMNMSAEAKRDFIIGMERGVGKARENAAKQWNYERDTVHEVSRIIELLARSKAWGVENGRLVFADPADVRAFNAHLRRGDEIAALQTQLVQQGFEQVDASMESIKTGRPITPK